jgi:hypothetical protein
MPTWLVKRTLKTVVIKEVEADTAAEATEMANLSLRGWRELDDEVLDETVRRIAEKD